jgi:hypothetical protein
MLATASNPRGERSSLREMKLPAALLMRSVSGPVSNHLVDAGAVADVDAMADHLAAVFVHQFLCGFVADDFAAAADVHLRAELKEFLGHAFAEPGAAACHEDFSAGEKVRG